MQDIGSEQKWQQNNKMEAVPTVKDCDSSHFPHMALAHSQKPMMSIITFLSEGWVLLR